MEYSIPKESHPDDKDGNSNDSRDVHYDLNSPAVTATMTIAGNIVNRLANNSNTCKAMCMTVIGLILGFEDSEKLHKLPLCLGILLTSLLLDCLYVFLRKKVTKYSYDLANHYGTGSRLSETPMPFIIPKSNLKERVLGITESLGNMSILPFYLLIGIGLSLYFIF
ncbi:MAG: hypothetical protein NC453_12900 [Muribaculum sp.]|nr:hypothetical protein [Muribaculum sp.]